MVSISVIFLPSDLQAEHQQDGRGRLFHDGLRSRDALTRIEHILTIRPEARSVLPEAVAQMHFDTVFGKADVVRQWQRARVVRHQSVQILRDKTAQAFAVAISSGSARGAHGKERD
jgi:hypothetical protein